MIEVRAPLAGRVVGLDEVPDEVFAAGMVGPGAAIEPSATGEIAAVSPVPGTLVKVHPHAFAVATDDGTGVLVHLGIDTVGLRGEGFTVHVDEGAAVAVGEVVVTWNPADVRARGLSARCPVVVLDVGPERVTTTGAADVIVGEVLLEVVPGSP